MRAASKSRGYTVLEVMIFLAVSGFMFLIAAVFVQGKQAQGEFKQSMNDINTKVQQVINDVSNGFYPSNNSFSCSSSSGPQPILIITGLTASTQGSNLGCVFLGKVIQFGVNSNRTGYNIYTVAGSQYANGAQSGSPPNSFANAVPTTIDGTFTGGVRVNLTEYNTLQWGLQASKVYVCDTSLGHCNPGLTDDSTAIGFFGSFANQGNGGNVLSGSQTVQIAPIPPNYPLGDPNETETQMVQDINNKLPAATANQNYFAICFKGNSGQYGLLTIGDLGGQRLTTQIQLATTPPAIPHSSSGDRCPL